MYGYCMDVKNEILRELMLKPGMEVLPLILDNWMTRQKNIEANCNCFNLLKKITSECKPSLSSEHNELVNICGGLYQRGLFNLTWTMILDKFVQDSTSDSFGGQKGGVKLQNMISYLFFAYTLLGVSEGIDSLPPAPSPYMSASNIEVQLAPSNSNIVRKPIRSVQDLELQRAEIAENELNEELKTASWVVDKEILIAANVIVTQADVYETMLGELNMDIAKAGAEAIKYCNTFSKKAERSGYFTSSTDYNRLKKRTEELITGPAPTATETFASYAFGLFSATPPPENLYSLTSGIAPPSGEEMAIRQALEEEEISKKINKSPFSEQNARSNKFMKQCMDIGIPQFTITTKKSQTGEDSLDIYLHTKVGNKGTVELYKSLMNFERDMQLNIKEQDDEHSRLYGIAKQLKEVIETGTVFIPIYSAPKSKKALSASIAFTTEATESYKSAVSYLSYEDPAREFASRDLLKLRQEIEARAAENRAQYFAEVSAPVKEVLTNLGHGAVQIAKVGENVAEYAANAAEKSAATVIKVVGDAAYNASDAILDVTENSIDRGTNQVADGINNLLKPVAAGIGLMGIAMILTVWFKKSMLTLKSSDPNTQQLINQVNALQAQLAAAPSQPLALPAAQGQLAQPLALPPAPGQLPLNRQWKQMLGETSADLLARRKLLREEASAAMKSQNTDNPVGQFDEATLAAARVNKYNSPGGGTLKRKKRTRKQKRKNKNTKVKRRTSVRY